LIRALSLLGLLANAGVVVLLFALSYYVFGGPEGPLSDPQAIVVWVGAMAICLGAAIGGWRLVRSGSPIIGLLVTWMPPLVAFALVIAF
jgi:hypothetical protein